MTPDIIPTIVARRWEEACANPTIPRWHSLAQMCSSMHVNGIVYSPESALVDDLKTLAAVAYRRALDMQPEREAA